MREPIYVFGRGGHAKVIAMTIEAGDDFRVEAFVDRDAVAGDVFLGRPVIAESYFLDRRQSEAVVLGIGEGMIRRRVAERLQGHARFPAVVHPSAVLAPDIELGEGTVVMPRVVVNPGGRIGRFCVLNTGAILDHDGSLGDFSALAPGVTVCGDCRIGRGVYVGAGATISHGISVGDGSIVGGGAFVRANIEPYAMWAGVPARFVRPARPDQPVL